MKICTVTTDQILLTSGCFQNNALRIFFFLVGWQENINIKENIWANQTARFPEEKSAQEDPPFLQVSFQLKQGEPGVQQLLLTRFPVL